MKNIILSAVALFAMSSFAVADGNIASIDESDGFAMENSDVTLYMGLGYGSLSDEEEWSGGDVSITVESEEYDQILFQGGLRFNDYLAVEGRYWLGMNDLDDAFGVYQGQLYSEVATLDAWGIYAKPMYPVTDGFDIYALLGYATTTYETQLNIGKTIISDSIDLDGFSWGIGAAYALSDATSIFADYTVLYDDTYEFDVTNTSSDFTIDTLNIGVTYSF